MGGGAIFNGYFSVDDTTNLVTSFYETINGSTNFNNNILAPTQVLPTSIWNPADNIFNTNPYSFTYRGVNISSFSYFTNLGNTSLYYNLALNNQVWYTSDPNSYYNVSMVFLPTSNPISNICFPAGTPITCNQGNIPIEKINPDIHTIRNKKIVGITKTITQDKYLVCFEKNALANNIPSQKTIISKYHCIFYKGIMREARQFIGMNDKIYKIKYTGEVLYNVLMEEHDTMIVNNLICETLYPENGMAKLYRYLQNLSPEEKDRLIKEHNEHIVKSKIFTSKK